MFERTDPGKLFLGAAIGTGMTAKAAEVGGADFLIALNAGRLRVMGFSSVSSMLPIQNTNDFVLDFAYSEILPVVKIPVFVGVTVFDPQTDLLELVDTIKSLGFQGVANFPTAIHLDGYPRKVVESLGAGFSREAVMVADFSDIVCMNFGWNSGGSMGIKSQYSIEEVQGHSAAIIRACENKRNSPLFMIEGGPIKTMEEAVDLCEKNQIDGYVGGSTIDRIPLEQVLRDTTQSFKKYHILKRKYSSLQNNLLGEGHQFGIYGCSPGILKIADTIKRFAGKNIAVLITGENGTGKELVARALHKNSPRSDKKLQVVNCAAIPYNLLESELFGHERGAFTGASKTRIGRFEVAHNSTVFLDEIGEMDFNLQAKLLRFLEDKTFERVGSNVPIEVDVRIICATNKDLGEMVGAGKFREDIFYRLNALEINVPPLRERIDDIPLLARYLLDEIRKRHHLKVKDMRAPAYKILMNYPWPGNVRQLKNVLEHAAIKCESAYISESDFPESISDETALPEAIVPAMSPISQDDNPSSQEREWILEALKSNGFRRGKTAGYLNMSRKTLYNKMAKYNLF